MIREAFGLGSMAHEKEKLPGFRAQQWYFFGVGASTVAIRPSSTGWLSPCQQGLKQSLKGVIRLWHPQVAVFYLYTRFITNNLLVEISSTKALAKLFAWALKRHMFISFFLYCGGEGRGYVRLSPLAASPEAKCQSKVLALRPVLRHRLHHVCAEPEAWNVPLPVHTVWMDSHGDSGCGYVSVM